MNVGHGNLTLRVGWTLVHQESKIMLRPCSFFSPSERDGFDQNQESLAKTIQIPLERNLRNPWDDWVREDLELTLEVMKQLATFFIHPCMEKSRALSWGKISRRMKRGFLELTQEWSWRWGSSSTPWGAEVWLLLDLLFFLFFLSFSLVLPRSCFFTWEREHEWVRDERVIRRAGSVYENLHFKLTNGAKVKGRGIAHPN